MKRNRIVHGMTQKRVVHSDAYWKIAGMVIGLIIIINILASLVDLSKPVEAVGKRVAETIQKVISPALTYYGNIEHQRSINGWDYVRNQIFPASNYIEDNLSALASPEEDHSYYIDVMADMDNKVAITQQQGNTLGNSGTGSSKKDTDEGKADSTGSPDAVKDTKDNGDGKNSETASSKTETVGKVIHFKAKEEEAQPSVNPIAVAVSSKNVITGKVYPKQQLENYSFLLGNFYTVTNATELTASILKPKEFLEKDMSIEKKEGLPQILIFHTHSQEAFADSVPGDTSTTIVGVGDYLATILHDKYGYNVYHDTTVYDLVNGKLDRSAAYTYAEENVAKILEANPSIEVVIDLHRDGVDEKTRLVTEMNGKPTAKIMFFNGLSYSKINKDIAYLPNSNRDDNLAMSLQMQLLGNAYYPGFLRKIYINSYRYVLHLRGKSTLVEAGAQNNTVAEVKNAMEPLADILDKLLRGERVY